MRDAIVIDAPFASAKQTAMTLGVSRSRARKLLKILSEDKKFRLRGTRAKSVLGFHKKASKKAATATRRVSKGSHAPKKTRIYFKTKSAR